MVILSSCHPSVMQLVNLSACQLFSLRILELASLFLMFIVHWQTITWAWEQLSNWRGTLGGDISKVVKNHFVLQLSDYIYEQENVVLMSLQENRRDLWLMYFLCLFMEGTFCDTHLSCFACWDHEQLPAHVVWRNNNFNIQSVLLLFICSSTHRPRCSLEVEQVLQFWWFC